MSPLQMSIMLHYYGTITDFRGGDFSAPAVADAMGMFERAGMLERASAPDDQYAPHFKITDGGKMYVEELGRVPLPVRVWTMGVVTEGGRG